MKYLTEGQEIIVVDFEWTAWEGSHDRNWSLPWEHREIIRIGAIKFHLQNKSLYVNDAFSRFCRPLVNTNLSEYICNLCSICQQDIDAADDLNVALSAFLKFAKGLDTYCNGGDNDVLRENISLNREHNKTSTFFSDTFFPAIYSCRQDLSRFLGLKEAKCISGELLQYISHEKARSVLLDFSELQAHNPVFDALSIAVVLGLMEGAETFSVSTKVKV